MGADEPFVPEKIIFGDIKTCCLGNGNSIVKSGGTFEILLQPFVIFEFGKQCFQ